ncbi:hypothetical protein [Pseudoalteromonas denitrificans]|uniref:Double zinc ribbon n=1 Tax=Pseudoalteromonas denitrificans DSM 6059 TaxID=1123010 RepID=A0A1I1NAP9_9GAMM|nr:hypothetical protein [Pseudoalteromonas denitrificans]SFC94545.1 hypothetical protein SAMN02745724_03003 [Pseudoalteromonas denitrificans DSM 6059]
MTWHCLNCETKIDDDGFETCWNCGCEKGLSKVVKPLDNNYDCFRCRSELTFLGTRNFHEGSRWGVLGDLGEFFVDKENLDMYACKSCGKVEFFISKFKK